MKFLIFPFFIILQACNPIHSSAFSAVAHASAGINNKRYTNSIKTLNHNYDLGFRLFKINFSWTSGDQLVYLHDWNNTASRLSYYNVNKPAPCKTFETMGLANENLTPCTLNSLNQWLTPHPKAFVKTDIMGKIKEGLNLKLKKIKNAKQKVIPQFTQPEHFQEIKDLGFENLFWTLFSYKKSNDELLEHFKNMSLFALTMPKIRAKTAVANQLALPGVSAYVHTINDLVAATNYQTTYGLSAVYTYFFSPNF